MREPWRAGPNNQSKTISGSLTRFGFTQLFNFSFGGGRCVEIRKVPANLICVAPSEPHRNYEQGWTAILCQRATPLIAWATSLLAGFSSPAWLPGWGSAGVGGRDALMVIKGLKTLQEKMGLLKKQLKDSLWCTCRPSTGIAVFTRC